MFVYSTKFRLARTLGCTLVIHFLFCFTTLIYNFTHCIAPGQWLTCCRKLLHLFWILSYLWFTSFCLVSHIFLYQHSTNSNSHWTCDRQTQVKVPKTLWLTLWPRGSWGSELVFRPSHKKGRKKERHGVANDLWKYILYITSLPWHTFLAESESISQLN